MTHPEQQMDAYDERLIQQLMHEGGIDPDVLEQRRRAQSVLEEGGGESDEKKSGQIKDNRTEIKDH